MRFLHCSDVHVTADYRQIPLRKLGWRRGIALLELSLGGRSEAYRQAGGTLSAIAQDVLAHRADHLIVSGDLTAYALEEEFARAREQLGPLADDPRRCSVVHGNHDVYTPEAKASRLFERYFGHLLTSDLPEYRREGAYPYVRLVGEDSAVVGLLSARVPLMPGFSYGTIGTAQLEGLAAAVEDVRLKSRAVLVVVHHAPLTHLAKPDKLLHGLRDADALFRVVRGPRFAVLHGHIHRRYHHPATSTRPHLFGAGSSTQAGREGYWLIETRDGLIRGGEMHQPGGARAA